MIEKGTMLPQLPTPCLSLIWSCLSKDEDRKALLRSSKATRQAFGSELPDVKALVQPAHCIAMP